MRASSHRKIAAQPSAGNTQLSLFDNSVIEHVAANVTALCLSPPTESKRHLMQTREGRGLAIAAASRITYSDKSWAVPSQTSSKTYTVTIDPPGCTCPDFKTTALKCKHIFAVEYHVSQASGATLPEVPAQKRKTYKQDWPAYNQAQTNEKSKFLELLYGLCTMIDEPPQTMGRPRIPLADRIFDSAFKVYSTLSGRRFMSDLREARQRGYVSAVPNFCSVSRFLESAELTPYLKELIVESSLPLKSVEDNFAVDSSGFATGQFTRWTWAKYGGQPQERDRADWLKVHIMCGCKTNIITAVEVTEGSAGDSPQFRPLVETTARNFVMDTVTADKAYSSSKNLQLVVSKAAMPYIAFRSNTTAKDPRQSAIWKRMYHFYMMNQERFLEHYHQRSNVESTFSMIKAKFGERLRSKTHTAQVNEVLCKILCHNLCCVIQSIYELGIEPTFASTIAFDAKVALI
jgi:transposase